MVCVERENERQKKKKRPDNYWLKFKKKEQKKNYNQRTQKFDAKNPINTSLNRFSVFSFFCWNLFAFGRYSYDFEAKEHKNERKINVKNYYYPLMRWYRLEQTRRLELNEMNTVVFEHRTNWNVNASSKRSVTTTRSAHSKCTQRAEWMRSQLTQSAEVHERFGLGFVERLFDTQRQWWEQRKKNKQQHHQHHFYRHSICPFRTHTHSHRQRLNDVKYHTAAAAAAAQERSRCERRTGKAQWNKTDKRNRNPSEAAYIILNIQNALCWVCASAAFRLWTMVLLCCCHCSIIYLVGLVRSYRMCVMQTHIREYEMRDKQLGTYRERERIVVKWCTNQAAEDCTNERTENGWWTCVCVCVCCWKIRSLLPEQILNESACVSARVCVAESLLQARCYYFTLVVLAKGKLCKGNEQKKNVWRTIERPRQRTNEHSENGV